jgi:hypothetical protein
VSMASARVISGRMVVKRRASLDFPAPGGPRRSIIGPPSRGKKRNVGGPSHHDDWLGSCREMPSPAVEGRMLTGKECPIARDAPLCSPYSATSEGTWSRVQPTSRPLMRCRSTVPFITFLRMPAYGLHGTPNLLRSERCIEVAHTAARQRIQDSVRHGRGSRHCGD